MTTSNSLEPDAPATRVITIRKISLAEVGIALQAGVQDFIDNPSHYVFAALLYPVIGLALFIWASQGSPWYLIYPMAAGFALIGPVMALGLYDVSRRAEQGQVIHWFHWFSAFYSPAIQSIALLALWLLVLFAGWLIIAQWLVFSLFANSLPQEPIAMFVAVIGSGKGWTLIILGHVIGFGFALVALSTTIVAFPLLLDQNVGLGAAVATSVLATIKNPMPVLAWGGCVVLLLLAGTLPVLIGLIVVLPVLGHGTWHFYRLLVQVDVASGG